VRRHFAALGPDGQDIYRRFLAGVRGALSSGMVDVFAIGLGLAALALVLTTLLPRIELATWSEPAPEPTPETAEAEFAAAR
jgi:hypothetical protein